MSYCRFAWDGSDVYVFESVEGLTCCGCRRDPSGFVCATPEVMIEHLAAHRRAGDYVPENAITGLWRDIPGAQRPTRPEPRTLTVSTLMMDLAHIEAELLRQHDALSAEDKASYELPASLTQRLDDLRTSIAAFKARGVPSKAKKSRAVRDIKRRA